MNAKQEQKLDSYEEFSKNYKIFFEVMLLKFKNNNDLALEKLNEIKSKLTSQIDENYSKINLQFTDFETRVNEELKKL